MRNLRIPALILLVGLAGSCNPSAGAESEPKPEARKLLLVVVFDPTILQEDQEDLLKHDVERLARRIAGEIERDSFVALFQVTRDVLHSSPLLEEKIELSNTTRRASKLKQDRELLQDKLRREMHQTWEAAHAPDQLTQLNSCIHSALYRVARFRKAFPDLYQARLLVLTDLLEACDDEGRPINFEVRLDAPESWTAARALDLTGFDRVDFYQFPNHHLDTREQDETLRGLWIQVLTNSGLEEGRYSILQDLPRSF